MTNNYADYANCDMSVLTKSERQVIEKAMEGKKYKVIAEELEIKTNTVGVLLNKARKKLEGNYENERKKIAARQKKYREKLDKTALKEQNKILHKKWYDENTDKQKEYNKNYYQEHKAEIIRKKKARQIKFTAPLDKKEEIKAAAKIAGVSLNTFCRDAVIVAAEKVINAQDKIESDF